MRRVFLVLALTVGLVSQATNAQDYSYKGYEIITVAGTAIGFTSTLITNVPTAQGTAQATVAICTLETANIRFTVNGTTPTSAVGVLWTSGSDKTFVGNDILRAFRSIRVGSSAALDCHYFGN